VKDLEFFESRRRTRPLVEFDAGGRTIRLQGLDGFARAQFSDMVADMREEGAGENETAWRIAVFACAHGIVSELGEKVFDSPEHALKVFAEWEDRGAVFSIAQQVLELSGLSKKSEEQIAKN
jgi:hypothetical protein